MTKNLDDFQIIYTKNCEKIAWSIATNLAISAFPDSVRRFKNGEISVSVPRSASENIVVASTVTNEDWIELLLLLDALRHSRRIILCMPYMGYSRQDLLLPNESYGTQVFAKLLDNTGISHCITLEHHSTPQLKIPTHHLRADEIFANDIKDKFLSTRMLSKMVIVSPDLGGAERADRIAKILDVDFAICRKAKNLFGKLEKVDLIGNVKDKFCIIVDDMIDTGATVSRAADALSEAGASAIVAYAVHGLFSANAIEQLESSNLEEIVLTNSLPSRYKGVKSFRELSIDSLLISAIREIL